MNLHVEFYLPRMNGLEVMCGCIRRSSSRSSAPAASTAKQRRVGELTAMWFESGDEEAVL